MPMNRETEIVRSIIEYEGKDWKYSSTSDLVERIRSHYLPRTELTRFEREAVYLFREQIDWEQLADYIINKTRPVKHLGGWNNSGKYEVVSSCCAAFKAGDIVDLGYHDFGVNVEFERDRNSKCYKNGKIPRDVMVRLVRPTMRPTMRLSDVPSGRYKVTESMNCMYNVGSTVEVEVKVDHFTVRNYGVVSRYPIRHILSVWVRKC